MDLIDKITKSFKIKDKANEKENSEYIYTFKDIEKMHEIYVLDLHTRTVYYGIVEGDILRSDNKQYISFTLDVKTSDEHKYEICKLNITDLNIANTTFIQDHYFISIFADDIHTIRTVLDINNKYVLSVLSKSIELNKHDAFDGFPIMGVDQIKLYDAGNIGNSAFKCMNLDDIYPDRNMRPLC